MFHLPYFRQFYPKDEWLTDGMFTKRLAGNLMVRLERLGRLESFTRSLAERVFYHHDDNFGSNVIEYQDRIIVVDFRFYKRVAQALSYGLRHSYRIGLPYVLSHYRDSMNSGAQETLEMFRDVSADVSDDEEINDFISSETEFIYCERCNELEAPRYFTRVYGGDRVCRDCIENDFVYSDYYDEYILSENTVFATNEHGSEVALDNENIPDEYVWNEDEGRYYHEEYVPNVINSYHSSKHYVRCISDDWTQRHGNRFYGVELEVEASDDRNGIAKKIHDLVNPDGQRFMFFERDGSLSNGFEMISQPLSLPRHRELWSFLKDRSTIRGLKSHNTTTCGLHVHVSREPLSALQIAKIVTFVNDPDNEELITAIARRYGVSGYAKIKNKTKIGDNKSSDDRYEAVNLTNRKTIEFRIFRGSLKYESVVSAIEFCNALVEFTKPCSEGSVTKLKADHFLNFVNKELQDETKFLRPYLATRMEV